MEPLTPAERRGALLVALLLALGAAYDLWRAGRPPAPGDRASEVAPITPGAVASDAPADSGRAVPSGVARIDLNRASARELDALPGVGAVLSARIVEHRERHGPYHSPEELLAVRGIGPGLYARLAPLVTVGDPVPPAGQDAPGSHPAPPARR